MSVHSRYSSPSLGFCMAVCKKISSHEISRTLRMGPKLFARRTAMNEMQYCWSARDFINISSEHEALWRNNAIYHGHSILIILLVGEQSAARNLNHKFYMGISDTAVLFILLKRVIKDFSWKFLGIHFCKIEFWRNLLTGLVIN